MAAAKRIKNDISGVADDTQRIETVTTDTIGSGVGESDSTPVTGLPVVESLDWVEFVARLNKIDSTNTTPHKISIGGGNIIGAGKDHNVLSGHTVGIHFDETQSPFIIWTNGTKEAI